MSDNINLKEINSDLKLYLDEHLKVQKIKNEAAKKMQPIKEKRDKALATPTDHIQKTRDGIFSFIEVNKTAFEKIRRIRSEYGVFGLIRCAGKVVLKSDEKDVVKALEKSKIRGRTRYIRYQKTINKNALLEDYRRGKLKPEQIAQLKDIDIEIFAGDIPFIRPALPNTPSIEEQEQKLKEAA